jgi:Fe-S-cluster containining protein
MPLKFYSEGIRFACQSTGRCCTSRGEYGFVYLNDADQARLAAHLGVSVPELVAQHCSRTEGQVHLAHPERDCAFLDGNRCGIYEARPEQCRTWPFWPENMRAKTWRTEVASFCPGVGKGRLYTAAEIDAILLSQE